MSNVKVLMELQQFDYHDEVEEPTLMTLFDAADTAYDVYVAAKLDYETKLAERQALEDYEYDAIEAKMTEVVTAQESQWQAVADAVEAYQAYMAEEQSVAATYMAECRTDAETLLQSHIDALVALGCDDNNRLYNAVKNNVLPQNQTYQTLVDKGAGKYSVKNTDNYDAWEDAASALLTKANGYL